MRQGRHYVAFEVKASRVFRKEHAKGLAAIAELDGVRRRILVYAGDTIQKTNDGIEVWPVAHLAEQLDQARV